ncbi:hypothetical protein [Pararhizobium mangrovi]|uniref:Uncharacterized protein n=1 Tax=Pararhizobium mangrovi TaxID=2590452 RepID=A0A506TZH5_9HYPH|nr:hypothetical protein FJU11_15975 [Pararhizobium mangrovi]
MQLSKGSRDCEHGRVQEDISYIRQMLNELRSVADRDGCDMLCYLIEMACLEASEIEKEKPNSRFYG